MKGLPFLYIIFSGWSVWTFNLKKNNQSKLKNKLFNQRIGRWYYKTLRTSVINSLMSTPLLHGKNVSRFDRTFVMNINFLPALLHPIISEFFQGSKGIRQWTISHSPMLAHNIILFIDLKWLKCLNTQPYKLTNQNLKKSTKSYWNKILL